MAEQVRVSEWVWSTLTMDHETVNKSYLFLSSVTVSSGSTAADASYLHCTTTQYQIRSYKQLMMQVCMCVHCIFFWHEQYGTVCRYFWGGGGGMSWGRPLSVLFFSILREMIWNKPSTDVSIYVANILFIYVEIRFKVIVIVNRSEGWKTNWVTEQWALMLNIYTVYTLIYIYC